MDARRETSSLRVRLALYASARATDRSSRQLVEQGLGLLQVERIEAFGEPTIDRREKIVGLLTFARHSRAMRIAARSSQDLACCDFATSSALRNALEAAPSSLGVSFSSISPSTRCAS